MMIVGHKPYSLLLKSSDLQKAADELAVPLACIQAVHTVESHGRGFLRDGRPVILFERHIMYRQLKAKGSDVTTLALGYPNIVNLQRGGYMGGAAEHQRLNIAKTLDTGCAIASTSWGCFQIMGWHWQRLGYASAQAFSDAMYQSEAHQLDAFVRFVKTDAALYRALKNQSWADFARGYNGAAYKENQYDVKLEQAYQRYEKRRVLINPIPLNA
jgi:hypothetical protein